MSMDNTSVRRFSMRRSDKIVLAVLGVLVLLIIAVWVFIRKFKLTDEVVEDNSRKLASRKRM